MPWCAIDGIRGAPDFNSNGRKYAIEAIAYAISWPIAVKERKKILEARGQMLVVGPLWEARAFQKAIGLRCIPLPMQVSGSRYTINTTRFAQCHQYTIALKQNKAKLLKIRMVHLRQRYLVGHPWRMAIIRYLYIDLRKRIKYSASLKK